MRRIHQLSIAIVTGATLFGCIKTQRGVAESADPTSVARPAPVGSDAPTEGSTADEQRPSATSSVPDVRASCAVEVKRQIACKSEYVPMIVDTRIKLDFPPGMAARGKDKAGRDELVAIAMREFPEYYAVEKIPTICEKRQAMVERMPPEVLKKLTAVGANCHTEKDCKRFAKCVAPVVETILAMAANSSAQDNAKDTGADPAISR